MEGIKQIPQSLVKQDHQLAINGDKVIEVSNARDDSRQTVGGYVRGIVIAVM